MLIGQSWYECEGGKRKRAVEVQRGGALLGGQQTKRARNLRFLCTLELLDTHALCMFMCQYGFISLVVSICVSVCYVFVVFWFVHVCVQQHECASVLYIRKQSKSLFI